jgi:DNA-binding LytR/AlgR family response regulator
MSKSTILIVEDEPLIADDIAMILGKNKYTISNIVDNAKDALASLSNSTVDLILCDVNIEGDKDGIQLAHQINKQFGIPLIFITSYYDNTTLQRAKGANPVGYIVKPFNEGDLIANIELSRLKTGGATPKPITNKFFIRDNNNLLSIDAQDILYVESDDNYATIYTATKKQVVSHTLKSIEEQLPDKDFVRIHKSYLVNFRKITNIQTSFAYVGDIKLPIGRAYKENLLNGLSIL